MPVTMIERRASALDGSVKYGWELQTGEKIESVAFWKDASWVKERRAAGEPVDVLHLCISSQVGCNVGCTFCATGLQRASRSLTAQEILEQVDGVLADSGDVEAPGVTFAGMGEPLLNYRAVTEAARAMIEGDRVANVSLSTVGIVPNLYRLAELQLPLRLFISVHAPDDELRQQLIPYNRHFPLGDVLAGGRAYSAATGQKVEASYLLLAGTNDSIEQAHALGERLDPEHFNVQILMWNAVPEFGFVRASDEWAERFAAAVREHGHHVYVMGSKARDIEGACGQLVGRRHQDGAGPRG